MSFVTDKINISPDIKYVISQYIREYDISKCNINMLLLSGDIDIKLYNKLYNSSREYREIYIGKLIKNNYNIYKSISNGVIKYRNILFEKNNINENDILTIKNDAVFTINRILEYTKFDNYIEFKNKNIYTSFFMINNLELYYNINTDDIHVKGISDDNIKKHHEFLELIKTLIYLIEMNMLTEASNILLNYYYKFISGDISLNMLRNFNSESKFTHNIYNEFEFDSPIDLNTLNYNSNVNISILI